MRPVIVVAAWVALAASAWAQAFDPAAFQTKVEAARQQMDADPSGAAEALDHLAVDSIELRKTRSLSAVERPVHSQLFLLRARAHIQLLNNDKAEESIRELLRVDPLFAGQLAPREQELVDALRQKEGGIVEVTSRERGARVLVEGVELGTTGDTPVRMSIVAGAYELRLEKPGFKAAVTRVKVAPGQTLTVDDLTPERNVPPIAFLTDRDDVEVVADNVPAGRTVKLAALRQQLSAEESAGLDRAVASSGLDAQSAAGMLLRKPPVDRKMTVRFRRDCLIEEARTIEVTSDALARLDPQDPILWFGESAVVRMRPDVGTLRVSSTPSDADVYLDGQLAGRTPFDREVCTGPRRVRVRHRIGSFNVTVTITRGRSEVIDAALKPDLAFLGAFEASQGAFTASPGLTTTVDRALASVMTSFHLASPIELAPEMPRWTDRSNVELVAAADKNDTETLGRLLKQAAVNFDAPLLLCAVRRPGEAAGEPPLDLLFFWSEHAAVDRVRVTEPSEKAVAAALQSINASGDGAALVYRTELGIRVADTALPEARLMVVAVQPGSAAAASGIKVGDAVESVDRAAATAAQLADKIRQKQPGDTLTLRIASAGTPPRDVPIPVQRRPYHAPAFDASVPGNALIAKLTAGTQTAAGVDRDLLGFSLALTYMRFREWRRAIDLLTPLGNLPPGEGVGRGAALYYRARCHEELGERDRAAELYKEASTVDGEVLADDGASVGALARYRLVSLAAPTTPGSPYGMGLQPDRNGFSIRTIPNSRPCCRSLGNQREPD